jgi:hypothetical protein
MIGNVENYSMTQGLFWSQLPESLDYDYSDKFSNKIVIELKKRLEVAKILHKITRKMNEDDEDIEWLQKKYNKTVRKYLKNRRNFYADEDILAKFKNNKHYLYNLRTKTEDIALLETKSNKNFDDEMKYLECLHKIFDFKRYYGLNINYYDFYNFIYDHPY